MESTKFPGLAEHRAKHREMAGRIADLASRHEKRDAAVYLQLLYFVRDYQSKHMQNEDQEYARWLSAHGVKWVKTQVAGADLGLGLNRGHNRRRPKALPREAEF